MIRLLRKIRLQLLSEDKSKIYILYASGEVLLVVIGILLALQIDNWNENRKENNQITKYAKSLTQDLEKDIEMLKVIEYTANQIADRIDSLSSYVRNKKIEDLSNLTIVSLTWVALYRPYKWNRATLEELKSSGSLRLIKNKELSKIIVAYEAFTRHMDEDYYTDKALSDKAIQLLSQVTNNNYPNYEQINELFRFSTAYGQMDDIYSNPIYTKAEESDLSLLTNDIAAVHYVLNIFIRLQSYLRIRTHLELPLLIKDAEALIKGLNQEYNLSTSINDRAIQNRRDSIVFKPKYH